MIIISCFSEFAKEKSRAQKSGEFQKLREKQLIDDAYHGYLEWIAQAGKSPLSSTRLDELIFPH